MSQKRKLEACDNWNCELIAPLPLPLRLTRENLSKLESISSAMPLTPSIPSMEEKGSHDAVDVIPSEARVALPPPPQPVTPSSLRSQSERTTTSSESTSISRARDILTENGMFINDDRRLSDTILDHFYSIVKSTRHSAMKPSSAKLLVRMRKDLAMRNEDTFLGNIKPLIFKPTREVEDSASTPNHITQSDLENWTANPLSENLLVERAYIEDHLDCNINKEFTRGFIPLRPDDELALANLFSSRSKPANAKPDLTFGTSHRAWTDEEQAASSYIGSISHISEGINYPFLILEGKSASGTLEDAQNQACRAGAALVNAYVQLQTLTATQNTKDGADLRTFVFSIAMTPTLAHVNAHWCFRQGSTIEYHMTKLSGHQLDEVDDVITLRRNINNILDWGLLRRKMEIKDDLRRLREKMARGEVSPSTSPKKRLRVV